MNLENTVNTAYELWPRLWRLAVVVLCTVILCSCRGPAAWHPDTCPERHPGVAAPCPTGEVPDYPMGLPPEAYSGMPGEAVAMVDPNAPPHPYEVTGAWAPPGFAQPWPDDEYLYDGGDSGVPATVDRDWQVQGVRTEDTIAVYDTLAGDRVVQPSNRVHIYAPRFGAVRQVEGLLLNQQNEGLIADGMPVELGRYEDVDGATTSIQNLQPDRQIVTRRADALRVRQGEGVVSTRIGPIDLYEHDFKPYEDLTVIRLGTFKGAEMARLAAGVEAAITWSGDEGVQVVLDRQAAAADVSDQKVEIVYTVNEPPANPKLRIVKVASTQFAQPGDEIDFTLRFDNVGNQRIGNVTIIDSLTPRLAYVEGSAKSSLPASFSTQYNEGDSLVLRWEIADPLNPEEGGVLRFRCRVR